MSTMTSMDAVSDPDQGDTPSPTGERPVRSAKSVAEQLVDGNFLDLLFDKVDAGELQLTARAASCPR